MKKSNKRRNLAYLFYKLLGASITRSLGAMRLSRRFNPPMINFPADCTAITKLLLVMPDDPIDALHRIPLCIAFMDRFKGCAVTLLCTTEAGPYLKGLQELVRLEEYDADERFSGSRLVWSKAAWLFDEHFSLTLLLERNPDDVLLTWCGATSAPVRAGFAGSGQYPFLNMQFKNATDVSSPATSNIFIASLFGAVVRPNFKWMVSRSTIEETGRLLREYKIPDGVKLTGVDIDFCVQRCGMEWTEALIRRLKQVPLIMLYAVVSQAPDAPRQRWLNQLGLPLIMQLPVPLLAGLLHQSAVVISGKSICGEMTLLLHNKVVYLLTAEENADFSALSPDGYGVVIGQRPDEKTIENVFEKTAVILAQAPLRQDSSRPLKRGITEVR